MVATDYSGRYCVIGAGSSGLTVAKNFRDCGVPFDVIERTQEVGGAWHYGTPGSGMYKSTHLISSKRRTEYIDFPMPDEYPDYPNHVQVFEYLRSYARHFQLYDHIRFGRTVEWVEPADRLWQVRLDGGEVRRYAGVVIANGHNWDPRWPEFPGTFDGTVMHAIEYKTADVLRDRRVLVVGAGNSGCDIAVESAQNAARTFHSMRRGYHFMPKFVLGAPADEAAETMLRLRLPLWLRRFVAGALAKMILGSPEDYGLKKPDHKLLETHPIVNSQMLYYVGHGDITVKPNISRLCGHRVRFEDRSEEEIDVIIYATGYKISFPFIDARHLNVEGERPDLFLNVFHPKYDNLFVAGLIQPDSGQFGLVDCQAQLIARFVAAQGRSPQRAEQFRRMKTDPDRGLPRRIHYVDSPRHQLEIEHFPYRRRLEELIDEMS